MIGKIDKSCLQVLQKLNCKSTASDIHIALCELKGEDYLFGSVYEAIERMIKNEWVTMELLYDKKIKRDRRYFSMTKKGRRLLDG